MRMDMCIDACTDKGMRHVCGRVHIHVHGHVYIDPVPPLPPSSTSTVGGFQKQARGAVTCIAMCIGMCMDMCMST